MTTTIDTDHSNIIYRDAYGTEKARIEAVLAERLLAVNVDVGNAVTVVRGAVDKMRGLASKLETAHPGFDEAHFTDLVQIAFALVWANGLSLIAEQPPPPLDALVALLMPARATLATDAAMLAKHGLIDGSQLDKLHNGPGYQNLHDDMVVLISLFRGHEDLLAKTPTTLDDLAGFESKLGELGAALVVRLRRPELIEAAALMRQKAFTLFVELYDELRRIVSFLRWHEGDADEFAPSIHEKKATRKTPPEKGAADKASGAASAETAAPATAPAPVAEDKAAPPAMRGGSPFTAG